MDRKQLILRMEDFAARVAKMVDALPRSLASRVFGEQVLRSAASVGSNYCESGYASSKRHFVTTLEIAQREAGETTYWLRVIAKIGLISTQRLASLIMESNELFAILTAAGRTAKKRS